MMKKSRPGCITLPGILLAGITALTIMGFVLTRGGALFNPGALNARSGAILRGVRSHAEVTDQCGLCHAPFWSDSTMADRCFICHDDVRTQLQVPSSLHGALIRVEPAMVCRNCHSEHHGPDAVLTKREFTPFDHAAVGFSLSYHQVKTDGTPFACKDCHAQADLKLDQSSCGDCHMQIELSLMQAHTRTFGQNCLACHDGVDGYGKNFDHSRVAFPLTGDHARTPCEQCHINSRSLADLTNTPQDCNSCHVVKDVHQGFLGTGCDSCHTTTAWLPLGLDHNLTAFALTGRHAALACENCHLNAAFKTTPVDCKACHAGDDRHKGNLGSSCANCHTTEDWAPLAFDHNSTSFKLTGNHANLDCESCHINGVLKGTPTSCQSCHAIKDVHGGKLGSSCVNCHTTSSWIPLPFDHNSFAFKLTGRHATLICESCHINTDFERTPTFCIICHAADDRHDGVLGQSCGNCHTTMDWTPLPFDHSAFSFKLTGKHALLYCESCHANGIFEGLPNDCQACHAGKDIHNGDLGLKCGKCHTTRDWNPAPFDHNSFAFKLTGKHLSLKCESCHTKAVFKGTPANCNDCHASDDPHNGSLGGDCSSCHTTSGWKPSTFDHSQTGFPLTGAHVSLDCSKCHSSGVFSGLSPDCDTCHAGEPNGHGLVYGKYCGSCHTTSIWVTRFTHPGSCDVGVNCDIHAAMACSECHIVDVGTVTCDKCHIGNLPPH